MSQEQKIEYKFYVKASPDGKSLGDCPFTQRANLALKLKGVRATYVLIDLSAKPKWFLGLNPAGSSPTLQFDDRVIADSYDIVRYLEETYPHPTLDLPGNEEAERVTGDVFSVFSSWAKSRDASVSEEAKLRDSFTAELEKIDAFLASGGHTFLCGDTWSIADCILAPRLYHITEVARHFKGYTRFEEMPALQRYMKKAFGSDVFKATDYPPEFIHQGWSKYFQ